MRIWSLAVLVLMVGLIAGGCTSSRQLTEREEYFAGRAVAANAIVMYGGQPVKNDSLCSYLDDLGNIIAIRSERPQTYKGYHVAVLNSPEVNALACPGGFIFLTSAAVARAQNEDELAAVIAHEIAHVVKRHPEASANAASSKEGLAGAAETVGILSGIYASATGNQTAASISEWSAVFKTIVADIVMEIINRGFSREQETEADLYAVELLSNAGYDPGDLKSYLTMISKLPRSSNPSWLGSTHPSPEDRIAAIDKFMQEKGIQAGKIDRARTERFFKNTSSINRRP
jgi:beta-barrel assembly-enhancing protease